VRRLWEGSIKGKGKRGGEEGLYTLSTKVRRSKKRCGSPGLSAGVLETRGEIPSSASHAGRKEGGRGR